MQKTELFGPGIVAHIYNLSYSGGEDWEDQGSRAAQTKGYQDFISTKKQMWLSWCNPT
jgi:hypothetical protein